MELSYQEQILRASGAQKTIEALKVMEDCFAVVRLEKKLEALYRPAAFNESLKVEMNKVYDEIDVILEKYGLKKTNEA